MYKLQNFVSVIHLESWGATKREMQLTHVLCGSVLGGLHKHIWMQAEEMEWCSCVPMCIMWLDAVTQ